MTKLNNINTNFATLTEEELIDTEGGEIILGTAIGIASLGFAIGQALARKYK